MVTANGTMPQEPQGLAEQHDGGDQDQPRKHEGPPQQDQRRSPCAEPSEDVLGGPAKDGGVVEAFPSSANMMLNHSGATMSSTPAAVSTFILLALPRVQASEEPEQDARQHGHGDRP